MLTPDPRGWPAQSFTATVSDRFEDSKKGKTAAAVPIDLAVLFSSPPPPPPRAAFRELPDAPPRATVSLSYEEKKLYIPTGKRKLRKKDGKPGAEEKIPVILVTATATVADGRRAFYFRTSNRSTTIFDSRDKSRKPLADVKRELARLCPPDAAEKAAIALAEYMAKPRPPKAPKPYGPRIENFQPPNPKDAGGIRFAGKRVAFSARKHLIDPVWAAIGARESAVERFDRELAASA